MYECIYDLIEYYRNKLDTCILNINIIINVIL